MKEFFDWTDCADGEEMFKVWELYKEGDGSFEKWAEGEGIDLTAVWECAGEKLTQVEWWAIDQRDMEWTMQEFKKGE